MEEVQGCHIFKGKRHSTTSFESKLMDSSVHASLILSINEVQFFILSSFHLVLLENLDISARKFNNFPSLLLHYSSFMFMNCPGCSERISFHFLFRRQCSMTLSDIQLALF